MVNASPLRSCGLNNHNRQAEAFPFCWDPGLTGNYSSACLITMEIDFIQRADNTQNYNCMYSRCVPASRTPTSLISSGVSGAIGCTLWLESPLVVLLHPARQCGVSGSISSPSEICGHSRGQNMLDSLE